MGTFQQRCGLPAIRAEAEAKALSCPDLERRSGEARAQGSSSAARGGESVIKPATQRGCYTMRWLIQTCAAGSILAGAALRNAGSPQCGKVCQFKMSVAQHAVEMGQATKEM